MSESSRNHTTHQTAAILSDYTIRETASILSSSHPTVYKLINDRKLAAYKVGRCTRITRESVNQLRSSGFRGAV